MDYTRAEILRIKRLLCVRESFFAGDNGFEPLLVAPEATVLPLDESPINQRNILTRPTTRGKAGLFFARGAAGAFFYIHEDEAGMLDKL